MGQITFPGHRNGFAFDALFRVFPWEVGIKMFVIFKSAFEDDFYLFLSRKTLRFFIIKNPLLKQWCSF